MAKLEFSVSQSEAVYKAQFDLDAAKDVLRQILPFLEERKPVPAVLANYLAEAIRRAVDSPKPDRTLAACLHLSKRAGRPALDMIAVAEAVGEALQDGAGSINVAAELVSRRDAFAGVDVSTIKKHYRTYCGLLRLAAQSSNDPDPKTRWDDS